jgi:tripartite-type tricarboxylate transporter receptor subunit TctC
MDRRIVQPCVIAVAAALAACAGAATGAAADDFYKGKTMTVVNPSDSGGSYHLYAEIVARHIGQFIPGKPTVIIQDKPGAGGAVGAAYMMNAAPKDGTYIAEIAPGTITDPLIRKLKYDATKFQWLGSIATRSQVMAFWHTVPVKTIDDLRKIQTTVGSTGRAATSYVVPSYVNFILGTKMKIISGYKGGGDLDLAMERGEIQGRSNYYSGFTSVRPEWIRDHKLNFIVVVGAPIKELPNVPNVRHFLKPGSIESKVDALISLNFEVGQGFYAPPGVPAARVAILRKAFADMLADPATRKDCEQRKLDFQAVSANEVQKIITDGFKAADAAVIAKFRAAMGVAK